MALLIDSERWCEQAVGRSVTSLRATDAATSPPISVLAAVAVCANLTSSFASCASEHFVPAAITNVKRTRALMRLHSSAPLFDLRQRRCALYSSVSVAPGSIRR